jgi:hypothetical protein
MSDLFIRVKPRPGRRQFLQMAAEAGGAALLPASPGTDETFAQGAGDAAMNPNGGDVML